MRWPRFLRPRASRQTEAARLAGARERMVAEQLEARGITDAELLSAFRTVERHAFVDRPDPYGDHALPVGSGQTISQPYVVAVMTGLVRPRSGWRGARILEIGTGSGYQAAILAELGAQVVSIERHQALADGAVERLRDAGYARSVEVHVGDGTLGWPQGAPYAAILVTAAGPSVPVALTEQLDTDGGRLVIPVGSRGRQELTLVERRGDDYAHTTLEPVVFVPLIGEAGFPDEGSAAQEGDAG